MDSDKTNDYYTNQKDETNTRFKESRNAGQKDAYESIVSPGFTHNPTNRTKTNPIVWQMEEEQKKA